MFKAETLDAVGGRLYPWQNGPRAKSGRGGGVPMAGTPSHADVATERCLRVSHCEFKLHTEDSITVFNLRVDPACFTLAPSVTRLGADAPLRAFQTARLLQATGSAPVTFAVPFCTRPDSGEDDYILVIGPSFASWHTPSCLGRRMADTAAFCVDHLFPKVPVRQFVLTVPVRLRFRMAYSPELTTAVLRCFVAALTSDLRRRARKRKLRGDLETGAMTVIQRFGASLALNVHFHTLAVDGAWARQADGSLLFHPLPAPSDEDVARIARAVCRKVQRLLARGKTSDDGQTSLFDELANASVQGLVATGPRRGCRVLRLGTTGEDADATITSKRCAEVGGFNVHANTCARANDRQRFEILVRYLARPPIANDRLSELPDGRLALKFKQVWRDGTVSVEMDPLSLVSRLAASVYPPKFHTVRYGGILAPHASCHGNPGRVPNPSRDGLWRAKPAFAHAKWRPLVVPPPPPAAVVPPAAAPTCHSLPPDKDAPPRPPTYRCGYIPWHVLMRRGLNLDVETCPRCGGKMRLVALVQEPENIARYLRHLGLPTEVPALAAARGPPFWQSRVLRRRYGVPPDTAQT